MWKRMSAALVVAALSVVVMAQECTVCPVGMAMRDRVAKAGGKNQMIPVEDGVALVALVKSEKMGKEVADQARGFVNLLKTTKKGCEMCAALLALAQNKATKWETVSVPYGVMVRVTSADAAVVKKIQDTFKPMDETAAAGAACCDDEAGHAASVAGAKGDGVTTCLVTGEKLTNKSVYTVVEGKTYYFCCAGCKSKVEKNPAAYIKTAPADGSTSVKSLAKGDGVTTCLVTGEPIASKEVFVTVRGTKYYLCCPGCIGKVSANPDAYVPASK